MKKLTQIYSQKPVSMAKKILFLAKFKEAELTNK